MRYIKRFNEAVLEDPKYKNSKSMVDEYNAKKSILDSIYSKDGITNSQIESEVLVKVFSGKKESQNPILAKYSNLLKMERRLRMIEGESQDDVETKQSMLSNIQNLKSQSIKYPDSTDHYDREIAKSQDSIKKIDIRSSDRSKEVSDIQKILQKQRIEFKNMIKDYSGYIKKSY